MHRSLTTLLLLLMTSYAAFSQPNLNFKRVTVNWPTVELYFSVGCNGNPAYNMAKQDFRIYENGVEVKDFTLWCPDPTIRCPISLALVFDASGSMSGIGNARAKLSGHAVVDQMDGVVDEAIVLFFAEFVTIQQQITVSKSSLHSAVDALPVGAANTGVWDGIYAGIIELINNSVNQCRSVVVFSDGIDTRSSKTVHDVVSLANSHRIRVFTLGLGSTVNKTELEQIALLTGGKYYQNPGASELVNLASDLSSNIDECIITYEGNCPDGTVHWLELQLRNFCGGTDVKTKAYRPPLDSTTFSNLYMELGDAEGKGGSDIKVPLNLVTPIDDNMFYPFTFTLLFDPQCMQFKSVATPPGSLLAGLPITVTPVSGGVQIATTDRKLLNDSGLLLEFTFTTSNPTDTVCCEIQGIDAKFEQGCFIPIIDPGEICIYPRVPVVSCDIDAGHLSASPFPVTMRIYNTGDKEATNVRYRIDYNASDVQLVSPASDEQAGTPVDLEAGEFDEVTWLVAAKNPKIGDSAEFCITASFDNHEDVTCCAKTFYVVTKPIVSCDIDAPSELVWQRGIKDYTPNPFPLTMRIYNTGDKEATNVRYRIDYNASDVQLVSPLSDVQTGTPKDLQAGEFAEVMWQVAAKRRTNGDSTEFCITASFDNHEDVECCIKVYIPPTEPILDCVVNVPTIAIDNTGNAYTPMPIPVTVSATNLGGMRTDAVSASLYLPSGLEYNTGEQASKTITPSTLNPNQSGQAQWMLRHPPTTVEKQYVIKVWVKTSNADSSLCERTVVIPAISGSISASITASGPLSFCDGGSVTLDAGAGYASYRWSTAETSRTIDVRVSGDYSVTVWDATGRSATSSPITVTVLPLPNKPAIGRSGDVLLSDPATSWQWYKNGNLIEGATSQFLLVSDIGVYTVKVTNADGCEQSSDEFVVNVLGIENPSLPGWSITVHPEPNNGIVTLAWESNSYISGTVTVYDVMGRIVLSDLSVEGDGMISKVLDVSSLRSGTYILCIIANGSQQFIKIRRN